MLITDVVSSNTVATIGKTLFYGLVLTITLYNNKEHIVAMQQQLGAAATTTTTTTAAAMATAAGPALVATVCTVVFGCIVSAIALYAVVCRLARGRVSSWEPPKIDLSEHGWIIVTGGNRGLGLETVRMLLEWDANIVLACRDVPAGRRALMDLFAFNLKTGRTSGVRNRPPRVWELDLADLDSVRAFAERVRAELVVPDTGDDSDNENENNEPPLGVYCLINNAHQSGFADCSVTENDGFETTFQTNYLGHFLLSVLLLPPLRKHNYRNRTTTAANGTYRQARVIHVTSRTYGLTGRVRRSNYDTQGRGIRGYSGATAYQETKLLQILFSNEFNRREIQQQQEERVLSVAVHPGGLLQTSCDNAAYNNTRRSSCARRRRNATKEEEKKKTLAFRIEPWTQFLFGTPVEKGALAIAKQVVWDHNGYNDKDDEEEDNGNNNNNMNKNTTPEEDDDAIWKKSQIYFSTTEREALKTNAANEDDAKWLWDTSCDLCGFTDDDKKKT